MYGAIIGDIAGSIYEFEQIKGVKKLKINSSLIPSNGFYSDDSILTIAVADAILNKGNYDIYLKKYGNEFLNYKPNFSPYFKTTFSPGFTKWINENNIGNSLGNGAMMRISPVGFLFDTEEDVRKNSLLATIPSHNSSEAIECATKIALIIFYSRKGYSKEEIINSLDLKFEYKNFKKFNYTCNDTIDNCLYAFFNSCDFEDAIRTVISYGGDTDTNACIVGSMAEAMYGVPSKLIEEVNKKIPKQFIKVLNKSYKQIKKL